MVGGIVGTECDCVADEIGGQISAPRLASNQAEQMQTVRVMRIGREELAAEFFSFAGVAGLEMRHRFGEQGLRRTVRWQAQMLFVLTVMPVVHLHSPCTHPLATAYPVCILSCLGKKLGYSLA